MPWKPLVKLPPSQSSAPVTLWSPATPSVFRGTAGQPENVAEELCTVIDQEKSKSTRNLEHKHTNAAEDRDEAEDRVASSLSLDQSEAVGGDAQSYNIARPPWIAPSDWAKSRAVTIATVSDAHEAKEDTKHCKFVFPALSGTTELSPSAHLASRTSNPSLEEKIGFVDDDPQQVAKI
jgi:hypothetical protein